MYWDSVKRRREQKDNELWVTDVIGCRTRYELSRKFPEVAALTTVSPPVLLGLLAHRGLSAYVSIDHAMRGETEVEGRISLEVRGRKIELVGRVDLLLDDRVVDLKTAYDIRGPMYHHYLQLWLYSLIFRRPRAEILYITWASGKFVETVDWRCVVDALLSSGLVTSDEIADAFGVQSGADVKQALATKLEDGFIWKDEEHIEAWLKLLQRYLERWLDSQEPLWEFECNYCIFAGRFCLRRATQR